MKTLLDIFPEINRIESKDLKEKVIDSLNFAINEGGWNIDAIFDVPVTLNWEDYNMSLVEHINIITRLCINYYSELKECSKKNGQPLNLDTIIAGALLHDIGKFTEFCKNEEGRLSYSSEANFLRHPLKGALIASKFELPKEIIHIIATHSFEGKDSYESAESLIVKSIDQLVFNSSLKGLIKK